jgi:GIY-YIG catalytic domain-containing protein
MSGKRVSNYGSLWARNIENFKHLNKRSGVYVLCDGSMPVYIGQANDLGKRMRTHNRSKTKRLYWDHFSWFAIAKLDYLDDVEALMIGMLPCYLRILNSQCPRFANPKARLMRIKKTNQEVKPPREFPRLAPKKKPKRKRKK